MDFLQFVKDNLNRASEIAMGNFGRVSSTVKGKDANAVLTETDLKIGKMIVENIKRNYPNHSIIDEEVGVVDNTSTFTWIIDPIDGTSNYAVGLPFFGTQIVLLEDNIPIVGGINLPYFKEIYLSEKGKGTSCNGKQVHVTEEKRLLSSLIFYGIDSHLEDVEFTNREIKVLGKIVNSIRNLRSTNSCYDGMMVAKGKVGGYLNQSMRIWDIAPLQIVVEEAGGVVTDFYGQKLDYKNHLKESNDNFTICAAPPILHSELQKIIHDSNTV